MRNQQFARRAAPPSAHLIWWDLFRDWSFGFVVAAGLLAMAGGWYGWRTWEARDRANAPQQVANATVVSSRTTDTRGRAESGWDVTVQWGGKTAVAHTWNVALVNRLTVGKNVSIVSRLGRSGRVYIDDIVELPQASQRAALNPAAR